MKEEIQQERNEKMQLQKELDNEKKKNTDLLNSLSSLSKNDMSLTQSLEEILSQSFMKETNDLKPLNTNVKEIKGKPFNPQSQALIYSSPPKKEIMDEHSNISFLKKKNNVIEKNFNDQNSDSKLKNLCSLYHLSLLEKEKVYRCKSYVLFIDKQNDIKNLITYIDYHSSLSNEITINLEDSNYYLLKIKFKKKPYIYASRFKPKNSNMDVKVASIKKYQRNFHENFKPLISIPCNSFTSILMGKILSNEASENDIQALEYFISQNIQDSCLEYMNEANFSAIISMILKGYARYNKNKNSKIYAFEKNMNLKKIKRCDGIYLHNNTLIILEFKNNIHKKEDALKYIGDKGYVGHVLGYFKIYDQKQYHLIDKVSQVGIECFGADQNFKVNLKFSPPIEKALLLDEIEQNMPHEPLSQLKGKKRKENSRIIKKRTFFPWKKSCYSPQINKSLNEINVTEFKLDC
jgi:hypothetical protein